MFKSNRWVVSVLLVLAGEILMLVNQRHALSRYEEDVRPLLPPCGMVGVCETPSLPAVNMYDRNSFGAPLLMQFLLVPLYLWMVQTKMTRLRWAWYMPLLFLLPAFLPGVLEYLGNAISRVD